MANKLLFIVNAMAGKGKIKSKLADVVDMFIRHEYDVTIYTTQSKDDARRIAKERCEEFSLIVCSGGDGTLSEVVNGLMEHDGSKPADGNDKRFCQNAWNSGFQCSSRRAARRYRAGISVRRGLLQRQVFYI